MSSVRFGRSTGRPFAGGLPSSPRARSVGRNDTRERETERYGDRTRDSDYYPQRSAPSPPAPVPTPSRGAPTHSMRSHRSMTNMSHSSRGGPSSSSRTDVPDVPPLPPSRRSNESYNSSTSGGSYSSASGSSASFLDRMKGRGGYGYGSSRTSVEEEPEPQSRDWKGVEHERGWLRQRVPVAAMPEGEHYETTDGDESLPGGPSGYGLWLWSRVATAASTLTISVSKAWASNIALHPGELTPPGEESRLTRALKAYHIDKARDPTDLPEWLFEEHERRPIGRSGTRFRYREDNEYGENEPRRSVASAQPRTGGGRGLRDVYGAAAPATRQQETLRESPSRGRLPQQRGDVPVDAAAPTSKAHDRLKALRDAKRLAAQRNASVSSIDLSDRASDGLAARTREERGRSLVGQDRRQGDGPHRRAPSLPASVRPPHSSGLPPRPGIRRI